VARDWYAEGAEWLVAQQNDDGGWSDKLEDACFALLFLRRATVTTGDAVGASDASLDPPRKERGPEPARELSRLTDWLVAGPWIGEGLNTILIEPPFDPRKVTPRLGDKLARREWERHALKPDGWTDLDHATGREGDGGMYACATTLAWDGDEPLEAILWLDLEDGWDVYLDGGRVSTSNRVAAAIDGKVAVPLVLAPGEHRLLCLVEDAGRSSAAFGARLSDRSGRPLARPPQAYAVAPKGGKR
jgi:hypothetical protein